MGFYALDEVYDYFTGADEQDRRFLVMSHFHNVFPMAFSLDQIKLNRQVMVKDFLSNPFHSNLLVSCEEVPNRDIIAMRGAFDDQFSGCYEEYPDVKWSRTLMDLCHNVFTTYSNYYVLTIASFESAEQMMIVKLKYAPKMKPLELQEYMKFQRLFNKPYDVGMVKLTP